MKKSFFRISAAIVLFVFACSCSSKTASEISESTQQSETAAGSAYSINTENIPHEEVKIKKETVKSKDYSASAEAENFAGSSPYLNISQDKEGYSGSGYVVGISSSNKETVRISFEITDTQFYNISVCLSTSDYAEGKLIINGGEYTRSFSVKSENMFTKITYERIYLEKGTVTLDISSDSGSLEADYAQIENCDDVYSEKYNGSYSENKTASAKQLMDFLSENYGRNIISGQYVSSAANEELEYIHDVSGKYPAIRFADMEVYCTNYQGNAPENVTESCINWHEQGGIVGLMFSWDAPLGNSTVYASESDFVLSNAISTQSLSMKSDEEIEKMYEDGDISESCYALIKDMDIVAGELKKLCDKDIPVLWRPLHEAGGGWYWWGVSGSEAYKWLWQLMYYRYSDYFGLDNLIWIWNGQSSDFLVDSEFYDIASMDIYIDSSSEFGSRTDQFLTLKNIVDSEDKILAISEACDLPDLALMERDNAKWCFAGLWHSEYLYSMDKEKLADWYNSSTVITLDKTGDLSK